jgi:hypothetical protein
LGAQTAMDTEPELSASYCDEIDATLEELVSVISWQIFQSIFVKFQFPSTSG